MKQYLIGNIIKGKIDPEIQYGPGYDLDRKSIQSIVQNLKEAGEWTWAFIYETNAMLDNESLFVDLKILDPSIYEPGYQYSLELGDIRNYFSEGLPEKSAHIRYPVITSKPKKSDTILYKRFLPKKFHDDFQKIYLKAIDENRQSELSASDVEIILNDRHFSFMFEFAFEKYRYFVEYADPWDYIIESDETWFKFLPSIR